MDNTIFNFNLDDYEFQYKTANGLLVYKLMDSAQKSRYTDCKSEYTWVAVNGDSRLFAHGREDYHVDSAQHKETVAHTLCPLAGFMDAKEAGGEIPR